MWGRALLLSLGAQILSSTLGFRGNGPVFRPRSLHTAVQLMHQQDVVPRLDILRRNALAVLLGAAMLTGPLEAPSAAIAAGGSSVLETSIQSLETATDRAGTIQAMADVFEAAEAKTLLVRTKYKYRIINAINQKHVLLGNEWDQPLSYESGELKRRVDPYRTVDLKGYLQAAPFVGGAGYLAALFVQQALPELFVFAYPLAVFVFVAPIAFIVLST